MFRPYNLMKRKSHFCAYAQRNLFNACQKKKLFCKEDMDKKRNSYFILQKFLSACLRDVQTKAIYRGHSFTRCLYLLAYHIRQTFRVLSFPVTDSRGALRYKPEVRGFDSRLRHCNFWLAYSLRPNYGPGFDSASNRNKYLEYFQGIKAAGA